MGLARTIIRRSLLQRPGRTFFSILGVAVGIATVVAVYTVDHVTVLSRTKQYDSGASADLEVRPNDKVANPRQALGEIRGVVGISAYFQQDALLRPASEGPDLSGALPQATQGNQRTIRLIALEIEGAKELRNYHVTQGTDLGQDDLGPRELLLGERLAKEFGLAPGDHVLLTRPPRAARKLCIEGEVVEKRAKQAETHWVPHRIAGIVGPEGLGRRSRGHVVLMDFQAGRDLFEGVRIEPRYWVKRDPKVNLEDVEADIASAFSYELNKSVIVGQAADERAFRSGVQLAGLFAMVLGLFVIFHTLSMSLVERLREVAMLHALGASRRQVGRIFFGEALFIALLAGALGMAGGLALARLLLYRGITTLGVGDPVTIFEVPWIPVVPLTLVGVLVALLGSVYPLMRARGTDTVSVLRGEDLGQGRRATRGFHLFAFLILIAVVPTLYFFVVPLIGSTNPTLIGVLLTGVGVLALVVGLPLVLPSVVGLVCAGAARPLEKVWPLTGMLATRTMEQSPTRIAASVAAIALVTAAFVGLKGMTNSLRAEVETWADAALVEKVWVDGLPDMPLAEVEAKLASIPGVIGFEPGDARTYVPFLLLGMPLDQLEKHGPCRNDPGVAAAMRAGQSMIVSERLAVHRGIDVGDTVIVGAGAGNGDKEFTVVAISDEYGYFMNPDERMYGVTSNEYLRRFFCIDTSSTSSLSLRIEDGADPWAVYGEVLNRVSNPNLRVRTGAEILDVHVRDISRDFVLFDIILGLTAILAGLGVLNGQLLAGLERGKELGVLRALGMTRSQVATMVCIESVVIGVVGGLLGLLIGSSLTPMIVTAVQDLSGLPLPQRSAGLHLGLSLLGALFVALVAGFYPIWRMNRLDAVRAVRMG